MSSPRGLSSNCARKKGFDGNEEYYRITKVRMKFIKENWIVLISLLYNFKKFFCLYYVLSNSAFSMISIND